MNTLDRFIRVIYREQSLSNLLNLGDYNNSYDWTKCRNRLLEEKIIHSFNLNSTKFLHEVREKYISIYPDNYNPDEIDEMLNWQKNLIDDSCGLDHIDTIWLLKYIVEKLLFYKGGKIVAGFDDFLEWNGFINKIDQNILHALFLALNKEECNLKELGTAINHDNNRLNKILSRGMSENHMHLKGSGYTTDMNWYYFYGDEKFNNWSIFNYSNKDSLFKERNTALAFDKLKIVRLFLFQKVLISEGTNNKSKYMISKEEMLDVLFSEGNYQIVLLDLKDKIGYLLERYKEWESVYSNSSKKYMVSERAFLHKLFRLLLKGKMSLLDKYLFNTYILGISKFKFIFAQDNMSMGFAKFKSNEDIKEHFLPRTSNYELYKSVFDKYYMEETVSQIEFRIAPKEVSGLIDLIDDLDRANIEVYNKYKFKNHINGGDDERSQIKYGLIVHFIKDNREFNLKDGFSRKEKFYDNLNNTSGELLRFLDSDIDSPISDIDSLDYYRNKILGIDTANYEFDCRPELFGPTFRKFRDPMYTDCKSRFTYHVGEDFNTLANGLRAVDEVVEFLQFKRGDRLGHAMAIGIDIDECFEIKRGKLISPVEEYLDDIAWMYQMLLKTCEHNHLLRYLENEFEKYKYQYISSDLKDIDIFDYICSYNLRGDNPEVYVDIHKDKVDDKYYSKLKYRYGTDINIGKENHKTSFLNPNGRELFYRYHYSSKTKENGRKVMVFDIDDNYIETVRLTQKLLRQKIYLLDLSTDTDPSSNRKISYVNKYSNLPLFKFHSFLYGEKNCDSNLPISINTDDSAIFQTDLQSEYAYIVASQMREGLDIENIYNQIEELRKKSFETSFI